MAESADAADLKSAIRKNVRVQVPFSAPIQPPRKHGVSGGSFVSSYKTLYRKGIQIVSREILRRFTDAQSEPRCAQPERYQSCPPNGNRWICGFAPNGSPTISGAAFGRQARQSEPVCISRQARSFQCTRFVLKFSAERAHSASNAMKLPYAPTVDHSASSPSSAQRRRMALQASVSSSSTEVSS